jgi:hypothetical protein
MRRPPAEGATMANPAKLTIRVTAARNSTTITYRGQGLYRSLQVGDVEQPGLSTHVVTSSGSKAFWEAIIALVTADIAAGNGGGS